MKKNNNHTYTVELRFSGKNLEPDIITQYLNLQPVQVFVDFNSKSNRIPFWSYNGEGENDFQREWELLEQGLYFLIRYLRPIRKKIVYISNSYQGVWWCGHFQTSFDGGPTLSPKILKEISSFNIPLYIDNYFSES